MQTNALHINPHLNSGELINSNRILIVDDEPAILFAYRKMIEKEGMCVDICTCLDGAIRHIRTQQYLAVITDMRLSGSDNADGLELLRLLRRDHPATNMIVATGCGSRETEQSVRALGVTYYFEKPVQPADILKALKSFQSASSHAVH